MHLLELKDRILEVLAYARVVSIRNGHTRKYAKEEIEKELLLAREAYGKVKKDMPDNEYKELFYEMLTKVAVSF